MVEQQDMSRNPVDDKQELSGNVSSGANSSLSVVSGDASSQQLQGVGNGDVATVQKAELPPLVASPKGPSNLRIAPLMDVNLDVSVLLGKTMMTLGELLKLGPGSVVELSRPAGEPIDVLVNDRFFAKGEIVVVDDSFGIRILEIAEVPRAEAA